MSNSFLELKRLTNESFQDYLIRIRKNNAFNHIPDEVLEQWMYPHFNQSFTIKNYSSINFYEVRFSLVELTTNQINKLTILNKFSSYVDMKSKHKSFESFSYLNPRDLNYWKNNKTWATPPIIIKPVDFPELDNTNIKTKKNHHLIEGHNRLGYFKSINSFSKLADTHKVFLIRK